MVHPRPKFSHKEENQKYKNVSRRQSDQNTPMATMAPARPKIEILSESAPLVRTWVGRVVVDDTEDPEEARLVDGTRFDTGRAVLLHEPSMKTVAVEVNVDSGSVTVDPASVTVIVVVTTPLCGRFVEAGEDGVELPDSGGQLVDAVEPVSNLLVAVTEPVG